MPLLGNTGQHEKKTAADGLNKLFQRLAIQATLDGKKPLFKIVLIAYEQQPHIQLAGIRDPQRIAVTAAQHGAGDIFRAARIGQTNMRIKRYDSALGIPLKYRVYHALFAYPGAHRCACRDQKFAAARAAGYGPKIRRENG